MEIQALQDELSQRDAELKALRTDLATAYGKLKDLNGGDFESPCIRACHVVKLMIETLEMAFVTFSWRSR